MNEGLLRFRLGDSGGNDRMALLYHNCNVSTVLSGLDDVLARILGMF